MPGIIDTETLDADELPTIWSPVQWELTEVERVQEIEQQATASLLWNADTPEAILRLLLRETKIERAMFPPDGYDPEQQGEWQEDVLTFEFARSIKLVKVERRQNYLYIEYDFGEIGRWALEIEPEGVAIQRI
jgi:hypothetical protein